MQRGFVFCNKDFTKVLCIDSKVHGFVMISVDDTKALNKAMCLHDLTEAKNIQSRLDVNGMNNDLEITNIARLYKKFY
jgi:hypothetical protein